MNKKFGLVIAFLVIVLLAMPTTNVYANPAGKRISHATCAEVLVVQPQAPQSVIGTTVQLSVDGPNGSTTITLNWQGYNGPTAKWVGSVPNLGNGIYTFTGVDNSLTTTLNCWATPTPTLVPSKTPTTVPSATATVTLTLTSTEVSVTPSFTVTPDATATLASSATPTETGDPTETPVPSTTATTQPTATPTGDPNTETPTQGFTPTVESTQTSTQVVVGTLTATPLPPATPERHGPTCSEFINPNGLLNQNMVSNWPILYQTLIGSGMLQQDSQGFWHCTVTNKPPSTGAETQSFVDWLLSLWDSLSR